MKLSIITTITDPERRQDPYLEALSSFMDVADEVIIVDGGSPESVHQKIDDLVDQKDMEDNPCTVKIIELPWPKDWSWEELPRHLNAGLDAVTGDWVIKCDIDYIFDVAARDQIVKKLSSIKTAVATFQKYSVVTVHKYYQKGELPVALNMRFKNLRFGQVPGLDSDLCYPIFATGVNEMGVPTGTPAWIDSVDRTGITIWNYDYTFKTKQFTKEEFFRFSMAYKRYFGQTKWGETADESLEIFINMMKARYEKCNGTFNSLEHHPKYIRDRISKIMPHQFGFDCWGEV